MRAYTYDGVLYQQLPGEEYLLRLDGLKDTKPFHKASIKGTPIRLELAKTLSPRPIWELI